MPRRLVMFLLVLILPLQSVWAAAGAYCMHEQGTTQSHFGHHAHQHKAPLSADQGNGSSSAYDADCAACHHPGGGAFTPDYASRIDPPSPFVLVTDRWSIQSISLDGPERPKWHATA